MNKMNTQISVKVEDYGLRCTNNMRDYYLFSIIVWNQGDQPAHIKVPLTSYVSRDRQVKIQKGWDSSINGSKGINLLEGTFCQMRLEYPYMKSFGGKGDRLLVNVELGKAMGRICFTFEFTDPDLVLISTISENPPESLSAIKNIPSMASALKRIAVLEDALTEVSRKLDAMQRDFSKLEAMSQSGSAQTLSEVCAWLTIQDRVGTADLRARLLPLDVLNSALISGINELALDITGELALEEAGNEIIVSRKALVQILGGFDVNQFEKRISA